MIYSLKITDNYKLPLGAEHIENAEWLGKLVGKTMKFGGGVNFLCGPNGSGKTSLLSVLGHYFHCFEGGVPKLTHESMSRICSYNPLADILDVKNGKSEYSIKDGCKFDTDGAPVFFVSGELHAEDNDNFYFEHIRNLVDKGSAGEGNMRDFNELVDLARKVTKVQGIDRIGDFTDRWKEIAKISLYAYRSNRRPTKPTFILDEIEANLDPMNQLFFFKILFEQLSQWSQVIFTSHSAIAFLMAQRDKNVNVIETEKGYFKKTIADLKEYGFLVDTPRRGGNRKSRG